MVEINYPRIGQVEKIEIAGNPQEIFGLKSSKSFREYMRKRIAHFMKTGDKQLEMSLRTVLGVYDRFHPELKTSIDVESKFGVSGIQSIIEKIDFIEVTTWRKSGPFVINIPKEDIQLVIQSLRNLKMEQNIRTEYIAGAYCRLARIDENNKGKPLFDESGFIWNNFFGWRIKHLTFTIILNVLSIKGLIHYEKGLTQILDLDLPVGFQTQFTNLKNINSSTESIKKEA